MKESGRLRFPPYVTRRQIGDKQIYAAFSSFLIDDHHQYAAFLFFLLLLFFSFSRLSNSHFSTSVAKQARRDETRMNQPMESDWSTLSSVEKKSQLDVTYHQRLLDSTHRSNLALRLFADHSTRYFRYVAIRWTHRQCSSHIEVLHLKKHRSMSLLTTMWIRSLPVQVSSLFSFDAQSYGSLDDCRLHCCCPRLCLLSSAVFPTGLSP